MVSYTSNALIDRAEIPLSRGKGLQNVSKNKPVPENVAVTWPSVGVPRSRGVGFWSDAIFRALDDKILLYHCMAKEDRLVEPRAPY